MRISSLNIQQLIDTQQLIQRIPDWRKGERIEASKYDLTVGKVFESHFRNTCSIIGANRRNIFDMDEVVRRLIIPEELVGLETHNYTETDWWELGKGVYFIQSTEIVNMPYWLSATVVSRTSVFRSGCVLTGSVVDPGFSGNILVGLEVPAGFNLYLEKEAKVMSLVFEPIGTIETISPGELDEFKFHHFTMNNETYSGIWSGDKVTTDGTERGF